MRFGKPFAYISVSFLLVLFGFFINSGSLLAIPPPPVEYTTISIYIASFEEGNIVKGFEIDDEIHESFGLIGTWMTVLKEKGTEEVVGFFVDSAEKNDIEILTGTYRCEIREWISSGNIYSVLTKVSDDPNELFRYKDKVEESRKKRIKEREEESRQVILYGIIIFCSSLIIFLTPWLNYLFSKRGNKYKRWIIFFGILVQIVFVSFINSFFLFEGPRLAHEYYIVVSPWVDWLSYFLGLLGYLILFQIFILLGNSAGIKLKDKKGKIMFWVLVIQLILLQFVPLPNFKLALVIIIFLQILVLFFLLVFRSLKR